MIGIFHVQFNLDRVCSANLANFPELHHLGPSREPRSSRSFRKKNDLESQSLSRKTIGTMKNGS